MNKPSRIEAQEIFPGDDEANALLDRPRRKGWELPQS